MFELHTAETTIFSYCPTALLPYCPTALLPYCPTALLPYCPNQAAAASSCSRIMRVASSRLVG
ncbi:hypothetical protein F9K91_03640 [Brucella tritici]|uniref:Uncharacterized protein n=1 Tax=Brucella tritici TaxID=94626 RepID=A0A833FNY7_9HYPH|nr:hypothetical protein F9K91_03640 [Brucella tritici]